MSYQSHGHIRLLLISLHSREDQAWVCLEPVEYSGISVSLSGVPCSSKSAWDGFQPDCRLHLSTVC